MALIFLAESSVALLDLPLVDHVLVQLDLAVHVAVFQQLALLVRKLPSLSATLQLYSAHAARSGTYT